MDTEGLVLKAKVHSAKAPDQDGLKLLLDSARTAVLGLKHLWLDAGNEGRGKRWVEEVLGLSVEIVRRRAKPVPEELARSWATYNIPAKPAVFFLPLAAVCTVFYRRWCRSGVK